jgi:large subunit ribosomal protein L11
MEFCKQFNAELKIKPAKYAQYKLLCIKTNHLNLLLKLRLPVQLMEAAKLKSGSGEPNRKKVASVTWNKLELLLKTRCLT